MGLLTYTTTGIVTATPVLASQVKTPLDELKSTINGSLDAANLAAGAVTTVKLAAGATSATYVTALPGSPVDGQEIYFGADATNGALWHLRYRSAASGSYKWEYVGGTPLWAFGADSTHSGTSYGDAAAGALTLTLPALAGDYLIELGAGLESQGASTVTCYMSLSIAAAAALDADAFITVINSAGYVHGKRLLRKTALAASTTLTAKYKESSNSQQLRSPFITATPIRVG